MEFLQILIMILLIIILIMNYITLSKKETALEVAKNMGIGYNLANTFDNYDPDIKINNPLEQITLKGNSIPTKQMIKNLKKTGFKTIRFPITWINFIDDLGNIDSEWMSLVKRVVEMIIKNNMYCIINLYNDGNYWITKGLDVKNKYINIWTQIANEFKNFNEYLIFESTDKFIFYDGFQIFYDSFNDLTQVFVDTIRNSENFNKIRLLIITGFSSLTEYTSPLFIIPKDPYNKLAISMHFYNPYLFSELPNEYSWGDEDSFNDMISTLKDLKNYFYDKGIPVILSEIGVNTEFVNEVKMNSIRLYLHSVFSLSLEYGFVPCLWDTSNKNYGNKNYYNREINQWYDEKIQNIFSLISKGKHIKPFDYYIKTNIFIKSNEEMFNSIYIDIKNKIPKKMIINTTLKGKLVNILDNLFIYTFNSKNSFIYFNLGIKNAKKQYDGTCIFNIDLSDEDCNSYIYINTFNYNNDYAIVNNVTIEFKEDFDYFDYREFNNSFFYSIN